MSYNFSSGLEYNKEPSQARGVFQQMSANPFPLTKAENQSISQEPDITYETCETNLVISSKDRDALHYPNPSHYRIDLPGTLYNIKSIELVTVILPDRAAVGSILDEPCLYLSIEEGNKNLNHLEFSDENVNNAFAVLPLKTPNKAGGFLIPDFACNFNTPNVFSTPLASMKSLTVTLTDFYGKEFSFGSDSNPPVKALQNVFVFKVTTVKKSMDKLQVRSVF